jgi:hypothetical protein
MNPSPHFQQQPPQQQQQPPLNHVSVMPNNPMNLFTAGPQSQNSSMPHSAYDFGRHQLHHMQQQHNLANLQPIQ